MANFSNLTWQFSKKIDYKTAHFINSLLFLLQKTTSKIHTKFLFNQHLHLVRASYIIKFHRLKDSRMNLPLILSLLDSNQTFTPWNSKAIAEYNRTITLIHISSILSKRSRTCATLNEPLTLLRIHPVLQLPLVAEEGRRRRRRGCEKKDVEHSRSLL